MKFTAPKRLPDKSEFVTGLLLACYPELTQKTDEVPSAADYIARTEAAIRELNIPCNCEESAVCNGIESLDLDSELFRLFFEANNASEKILGQTTDFISGNLYKTFGRTLDRYIVTERNIFRSWTDGGGQLFQTSKIIDLIFFLYILLTRTACRETRADFFCECLEYAGITDLTPAERQILLNFDAEGYSIPGFKYPDTKKSGKNADNSSITNDEKYFTRKSNTSKNIFSAVIITLTFLVGRYNKNTTAYEKYFDSLYDFVRANFKGYSAAIEMFDAAERFLFTCVKYFEPRSIQIAGTNLYPQNNFVMPRFSKPGTGEPAVSPFAAVAAAEKSTRILIEAKTGLGKSLYLQTATLGMLQKHCDLPVEDKNELDRISKEIGIPEDAYVISVPARMFTYCFTRLKYKEWTHNLLTLFLNSMWKLPVNFFSQQYQMVYTKDMLPCDTSNFEITDELRKYVHGLAQTGKLVVLLDSFDEIPESIRPYYNKTVADFIDTYCGDGVGAHIIAASRSMSQETMLSLTQHLSIPAGNIYGIDSLKSEQKAELIRAWAKFFPQNNPEEIIAEINRNHYFTEFSENPYMLSLLCAYNGKELGHIISDNLVPTLLDKMIGNHRNDPPVIQAVLEDMSGILLVIAIRMLMNGKETIERSTIASYIRSYIDKTDRSDDEISKITRTVLDILVVDVGLIVPADGKDRAYQFINSRLLFEFAAKGLIAQLERADRYEQTLDNIFSKIKDIKTLAGLIVPVVCLADTEKINIARDCLNELVLRDCEGDAQKDGIVINALLDLLLNKYGNSIANAATTGSSDRNAIESLQRLLLMRLFASKNFNPTAEEKAEIAASPVYLNNKSWLADSRITN